MSDPSSRAVGSLEIIVQLLDPAYGTSVKTWRFTNKKLITIGRGDDPDIEISDAYVSRHHASLMLRDGQWVLTSHGRNGVIIENQMITELALRSEMKFRLGASGPWLRFRTTSQDSENPATICFDTLPTPIFQLDESKLSEEVGEIIEGDYFQKLQKKAKLLREQRGEN